MTAFEEDTMEKKKTFLMNIAYYGFFAALIFLVWKYICPVLVPFILAFLIASLFQKPAKRLNEKIHCKEKRAAIVLLILFYLLFFAIFFLGGGKIFTVIANFIANLPELYQTKMVPLLDDVSLTIGNMFAGSDAFLAGEIQEGLQQFVQNMGDTLSSASVNILKTLSEVVTGVPSAVVKLVVMIVSSFYMAADYQKITDRVKRHLPKKVKQIGRDVKKYGWNILKAYMKSYFLLFLLTFAELTVGLLILKIPYAIVIAAAIAVFDVLPVLGTGGVLLPWMAVMLVIGDYPLAIGLLILYVMITIVRNFVEPRIVGKQVGLHPLMTLMAMLVGLELGGLFGMILVPMAVVIFVNMEKKWSHSCIS